MAAKSGWMASSCCWEVPGGRQIISWLWAALAHAQHTAECVEVQSGVLVVKLCGQQQPVPVGLPCPVASVLGQLAAVWHAAPPPYSSFCSHPGQLASSLQGVVRRTLKQSGC
ncbi:hypothetical protein HaLaN_15616, partial [Haematococcus lacustris]